MLKTQYPTDYLKKEVVNLEVAEQIEEKERTEQVANQVLKQRSTLKRLKRSDSDSTSKETREPISIFQEISLEENQPRKQNLEGLLNELRTSYSNDIKIGAALKTGDCFFDTLAQGLNELKDKGLITNSERFNTKSLREGCADYAKQHNNQDNLVYRAIIKDADVGGYFVVKKNVVYGGIIKDPSTGKNVIEESDTFYKYLEDIKNIAIENGPIPIWGRLNIEGKMICEKYKVKIEVIELTEKPVGDTHIIKSEQGEGDNVIRMINYKQHFVPLLSNIQQDIEQNQEISREEAYGKEISKDTSFDNHQPKSDQQVTEIYRKLNEVRFDNDDSGNSHEWAGIDQINSYVNQAINNNENNLAYYIGPNNFGFNSREGINDIAKHICKKNGISNNFYGSQESLDKPFIIVSNTATVFARSPTDVNQQGGTHWISWVLLPKKYSSLSGKEVNNDKYQVLFFDSLGQESFPEQLKTFLMEGGEITETTDTGEKHIRLLPFCTKEEIDFKNLKDLTGQQMNGNDCGWWATYYALMTVYTGGVEFLEPLKGKKLSARPLRSMMNLQENLLLDKAKIRNIGQQFPSDNRQPRSDRQPESGISDQINNPVGQSSLAQHSNLDNQPVGPISSKADSSQHHQIHSRSPDYDDDVTPEEELINTIKSNDSEEEKLEKIKKLFEKNPRLNVNFQNTNKDASLHIAVRKGERKVVELLIGKGAKINDNNIRNKRDRTPLDIAKLPGTPNRQEIVDLLEEHLKSLSKPSGQHIYVGQPSAQQKRTRPDPDENTLENSNTKKARTSDHQHSKMEAGIAKQTSRKRPVTDYQSENSDITKPKHDRASWTSNDKHIAGDLKKSLHGNDYQLKLLMLFAWESKDEVAFRLATEMAEAEKFDDLVFRYVSDEGRLRYRFLQAKHRQFLGEENKIKVSDLKSSSDDNDFSLQKYFVSYLKDTQKPEFQDGLLEDFIICTNTNFDFELNSERREQKKTKDDKERWKNYFEEIQTPDKILNLWGKRYQFSHDSTKRQSIISELKPIFKRALVKNSLLLDNIGKGDTEKIKGFLNKDKKDKDIDEFLETDKPLNKKIGEFFDKKIDEFFKQLMFAVEQPSGAILDQRIKEKIGSEFNLINDITYNDFYKFMSDWMQHRVKDRGEKGEGRACFLIHTNVKEFFNDAKRKIASLGLVSSTLLYKAVIEESDLKFKDRGKTIREIKRFLDNFLDNKGNRDQVQDNRKQILTIYQKGALLSGIKVYQAFESYNKEVDSNIFSDLKSLSLLLGSAVDPINAFSSEGKDHLIIEHNSVLDEDAKKLLKSLYEVLIQKSNKRVILITLQEQKDSTEKVLDNLFRELSIDKSKKCIEIEDNDNKFNDLTPESQVKLLENRKVIFQGKKVSLGTLIDDESKHLIDAEVLSKLINSEKIEIGKAPTDSKYDDVKDYYIPRTFNCRVKIKEYFTEEEESRFFFTYDSQITEPDLKKDIVLISDTNEDFEKLCNKYKELNIHWLQEENDAFIWQKSHGTLSNLRKIIDEENVKEHEPQKITDITDRVVIVAAEPGMGKSTVLTKLAEKTKKSQPSLLVVRINLNDHTKSLNEVDFNSDKSKAINFLLNIVGLETTLEKELFVHRVNKQGKIALLFDGFDEISPTYKEKVIELLKILKDTKVETLWVTTRPHMRSTLENKLSTLSYTLKPLSRENQEIFLKKFWNKRLNLNIGDDSRLNEYIQELLNLLKRSIADKEAEFTGIPLQTRMLAEVFQDKFKEFHDSKQNELNLPEKLNLVGLYERFVESKYKDWYLVEKKNFDTTKTGTEYEVLLESFIKKHRLLALSTLFSEEDLSKILSDKERDEIEKYKKEVEGGKENIGIINHIINDKPSFVHRTFAEYFAALWFAGRIREIAKQKEKNQEVEKNNQKVKDFLREHIFKPESRVMRNFFDRMLAKDKEGESKYKIHNAILSNDKDEINKLLLDSQKAGTIINSFDKGGRTVLHLAAAYGYSDIVQVLLGKLKEASKLEVGVNVKDELFDWSPLTYAAQIGDWDIAESLLIQKANICDIKKVQNVNSVGKNGVTLLGFAISKIHDGKIEIIKFLVNKGANVYATNYRGSTLLHRAAKSGKLEIVKYLVEEVGIKFNVCDMKGITALDLAKENDVNDVNDVVEYLTSKGKLLEQLCLAIKRGDLPEVRSLVKQVDVNTRTDDGNTLLAVSSGNLDIVKLLIEVGADVKAEDENGLTPLYKAAEKDEWGVVEYLKSKGANINTVDTQYCTPLNKAVFEGRLEAVERLIEIGADVNASDRYGPPIHRAIERDKPEIVERLLTKPNININAKNSYGESPLHVAAERGKWEVVKYLVDKGADLNVVDKDGMTPLHRAAREGKWEIVKYLVDKGADFNGADKDGMTLLHRAAREGKWEVVKYLVDKGANFNGADKNGMTFLHWVAKYGSLELVKYLVDKRTNFNGADKDDMTLLHWVAYYGKIDVVKYLVDKGADLNVVDKDGMTPLHWAIYSRPEVVKYLVDKEADLNVVDKDGMTPLLLAVQAGELEVVKYLVNKGANLSVKDNNDKTPLALARERLAQDPENENLQTIIALFLSVTSEPFSNLNLQIQSNKKQQKAYVRLGKYIESNFPEIEVKAVKQGLYLSSFESRNVKIDGKCAAITRIFSQGLFLWQHESFLNNLQTSAALYERLAQGKQLSSREEKEIFALSRLLSGVEEEVISPTSSLPSHLSHIKSYKTLDDLSHYVNGLTDDFAIHLVTNNHVVAIYRTGDSYTYFDSNVALVSDVKSVDQLMKVVKKGVEYAGYELAEEGFLVEHFDVEKANNALTTKQKEVLEKPIQTERHLLSLQDQEQGLIDVNSEKISRVTLYNMGAKLHAEGSTPVLINSEMTSEDLAQNLNSGKIKITAREYLQNLKGNKKQVVQDLVQKVSTISFDGSANEIKDAQTIQDLVLSEDGQMLDSYQINKILKGPIEQSIKALPYYLEVANTKHWPNRLTNAAGRISMAKGLYDVAHSIRYGDTEGFLLGSGEIGFSLFSQLIEDGIVKVTPQFIKQMKHGIFLSRGFAGMISTPFDIYDLIRSSIDLAKAEKGSKEWRDSIAGVVLSGTSVTTSIAFTALGKPGVGTVVGLGIIIGQGFYSGTSMVIEYKKYKLTTNQEFRLFWHTFALQLPPEDVQYLAARQDVVNGLAEQAWEYLQNNTQIAAYAMGLGEISFKDNDLARVKRMVVDIEQSMTGARVRHNVYVPEHNDLEEAIKDIIPKPKIVVVNPSSASIGMLSPSNEREGKNLSRIVPVSPSPEVQMLCLPEFTHRDYEYDHEKPIYSNSSTAIYNCRNAMIVGRKHNTRENPVMVFDLSLVNGSGIIVSSSQYRNQFNIAQGGTRIYGGNYTSNVFTLTNDNFFGRVVGGTENTTNVLDVSQLKSKGLSYENNIITTQEAQMTAENINHFIGRNSADEHVNCQNMNKKMIVDSRGGNSRNSDVISNCKQVVVTGNTKVVSNESDNTFYIKPSNGYAEIKGTGKGFIIFSDTALLEKASNVSYSATNNTLSLQINLQEEHENGRDNNTFTLDINNYLDKENNHNYVLIDKYGSVIEPLIQPNSTEVTNFNLKAETNLTAQAEVAERYQEISQTNNAYTVYSVIRDLAERYTIYGSNDSDVIPLTKNVTFVQGNEESDVYSLMPEEKVNVTINNYDNSNAIDMLYLPMNVTLAEAEKVKNDLHISTGNAIINVENYFRNNSYRHLTVIDKNKNTFLPWSNNQSHIQLVPFFHAIKDQYMFLLSAEKVRNNPEVVIDANLEDIRFYRDGNDLMLMDDKPIIIKVESLYSNQYGNFTLNFRNQDKLSSKQLFELAKLAINYQDEIRSTYYESVREYVNPSNASTINHNQKFVNGSLTTVEPSDKRVGILLLQDPSDIEVSADNNDLVFFVGQNNATFVIKNWNDTDHRISMLKFGDEDKSIELRDLDKFDLSQVLEIQSLIDKAAISNTVDQQLERLDNEVVNGLKYLLASNGIVMDVHNCLGFDSIEDQQEFVAAYSTFYSKDKLQEILQHSQAVESLRLLIAKGHINLSLKDPGKEKHLLLKDLDQCFGAKNNFTIKNGNDRVSVLKFNQSIEVNLSEVSEIQHLIGKYGISNAANQQLEKLGNEVVNDFKYLLVNIDIENGIDVYNCLAEKDTQKILNPYYYEWVNWNLVKDLIEEKKVGVNAKANDGNTLLHEAASSGNLGIVEYLIDKGGNVNTKANDGRTPLHHAAASGNLDLVKYLVDEKRVNVNTKDNDGKTSLHYAAYSGNLNLVKYLEKSVDINTKDNDGNTILHDAASSGNLDLVNYFIGKGADVNAKTNGHWTPLHKAAEKGNEKIVLALLEKGVDVNEKTNGGYTALHWAALSGNKETVLALLNNGANVNAKIDSGETPLHLAASKGNKEAVLALLNKGANVKAKDDSGWTPLRTAEQHGKREVVVLLNHQNTTTHQRSRRAINEENIASSATRVGSRINDLFSWVKSSIGGLFNSRAALHEKTANTTTQSSISQVDAQVNVDGTIMLLDVFIRKITGQTYIFSADESISLLEAQGYALNITTKFEQVLNETAVKSGISATNLNFNPVAVQSTLTGQIRNGKFSEVLKILYSSAEKACPEFKQIDKFLACLANHLEEVVAEKEVELLVGKQKGLSKAISNNRFVEKSVPQVKEDKPSTFLNGASIAKGIGNVLEL